MMGHFFNGWRRKAGFMTLLLTCLFLFGWVRSQTAHELLRIYDRSDSLRQFTCIGSLRGVVFYYRAVQVFGARKSVYERHSPSDNLQPIGIIIPYWAIIPLPALLTAYLLFVKPSKSNSLPKLN